MSAHAAQGPLGLVAEVPAEHPGIVGVRAHHLGHIVGEQLRSRDHPAHLPQEMVEVDAPVIDCRIVPAVEQDRHHR